MRQKISRGGGNGKQRRGFGDLRRLISAVAVIFAATLFANSANAQEASASVFIRASGAADYAGDFPPFDFSDGIADIVSAFTNAGIDDTTAASRFTFLTPGPFFDERGDGFNSDNIPVFEISGDAVTLGVGHIVRVSGVLGTEPQITAIVYDADPGNGVSLAMITLSGETKTPSELAAGEYFLNTMTWTTVAVLTDTDQIAGFAEPTCGAEGVATDRLRCNDPLPTSGDTEPVTETSGGDGDLIDNDVLKWSGGLGVLFFFYAWQDAEGDLSAFSFAPDFGYAITDGGYSYNYGTRINFAKDNLRMHWTFGQTNRNGNFGEFRYASGGEYRSDSGLWTTAFSESVSGDVASYDFSLSANTDFVSPANFGGGIWNLSPTYRFNSVLDWEKNESDSRNSLNIESVLQMNRWTINPTAGFNWRRMNEFGNSAKFGIAAEHRF